MPPAHRARGREEEDEQRATYRAALRFRCQLICTSTERRRDVPNPVRLPPRRSILLPFGTPREPRWKRKTCRRGSCGPVVDGRRSPGWLPAGWSCPVPPRASRLQCVGGGDACPLALGAPGQRALRERMGRRGVAIAAGVLRIPEQPLDVLGERAESEMDLGFDGTGALSS